eukprot:1056863-Alexandrium_andersonii.AAC.1
MRRAVVQHLACAAHLECHGDMGDQGGRCRAKGGSIALGYCQRSPCSRCCVNRHGRGCQEAR